MGLTSTSTGAGAADTALVLRRERPDDRIVALAGNPNVGKSTVFNALTGLRQHTGNWPGKTVTSAQGRCERGGRGYVLVDLPGTYSLMAHSAEEEVARDFLCFGGADGAVVTAPGSSSSGESLPFGLDCSGFVSWCAVNAAGDPAAFAAVGNGVRAQRALCAPVDWADALPGDLAFYPDLSHVGIVAGRGADGGLLVLHCSYSLGGVVCSSDAKAAGFTDLGRPSLFEKTP